MFEIKNANIFKAVLPESYEELAKHLGELPYSTLLPTEYSKDSFVPNQVTGELATPIVGGYAFTLRRDEKVIPPSTIKEEVSKRVKELEDETGRKVNRQEKSSIKDSVLMALLPRAFSKPKFANCIYLTESNLLIVDCASATMASAVVRNLVKVMGSVKTTTIFISNIKNGLAAKLKSYVCDSDFNAFGAGLSVGGEIRLSNQTTGERIHYSGIDPVTDTQLEENLNEGFIVDRVCFNYGEAVKFTLNDQFKIGAMAWSDIETGDDGEDAAFVWRHEAGVQASVICGIVSALCSALEYKEPNDEQNETEQQSHNQNAPEHVDEQEPAGENMAGSKTPVKTGDPLADYWANSASESVKNTPPKVVDLDSRED